MERVWEYSSSSLSHFYDLAGDCRRAGSFAKDALFRSAAAAITQQIVEMRKLELLYSPYPFHRNHLVPEPSTQSGRRHDRNRPLCERTCFLVRQSKDVKRTPLEDLSSGVRHLHRL